METVLHGMAWDTSAALSKTQADCDERDGRSVMSVWNETVRTESLPSLSPRGKVVVKRSEAHVMGPVPRGTGRRPQGPQSSQLTRCHSHSCFPPTFDGTGKCAHAALF